MDPLSILVTALSAGAAAGLTSTTEKVIKDAYDGLKSLIKRKYSRPVNVELLESDPSSKPKQDVVREDLAKIDAVNDHELLDQAKALLDVIKQYAPEVPETVGMKLEDIDAASLTLKNIISRGSAVRMTDVQVSGNIIAEGVTAGALRIGDDRLEPNPALTDGENVNALETNLNLEHVEARDIRITQYYLVGRGVIPYQDYLNGVLAPADIENQGTIEVDSLRKRLLRIDSLPQPIQVSVRGTLFPCALLTAGWWDRHQDKKFSEPQWRDKIQKWLFHGFDLWGPSWDFTWVELHNLANPYVIAQLGSGDEADSIPVLIPRDIAVRLEGFFKEKWGGGEVEVTGLLGHRRHFSKVHKDVDLVGGLLDYCIWIDHDNAEHGIEEIADLTEVYSGYLWKCVTPQAWFDPKIVLSLNQVYFVWEHTNFRDQDAIQYNLDSLGHKEQYLSALHGPLILLQKSSQLVAGDEAWSTSDFYDVFVKKTKRIV